MLSNGDNISFAKLKIKIKFTPFANNKIQLASKQQSASPAVFVFFT